MIAELFNYNCWVLESNATLLKDQLKNILEQCEFEILGFMEHHFLPQGYTCIWLLGESHLAVHTYPEHNQAYIELTSCVEYKNENFKQLLTDTFNIVNKNIKP